MRILISPRASRDLETLVDWLTERSPPAARRALAEYLDRLDQLSAFPKSGPVVSGETRQMLVGVGRDGMIIRYVLRADQIRILRVLHGRQDR